MDGKIRAVLKVKARDGKSISDVGQLGRNLTVERGGPFKGRQLFLGLDTADQNRRR